MKQYEMSTIFVTCPKGLQYALEGELEHFGANEVKPTPAGVSAEVDRACLYKILLWSRIANRVIVIIANGKVSTVDDLYDLTMGVKWQEHFTELESFSVDFLGTNELINNSQFGALKVKDAIVDQFRQETGTRPSVEKKLPNIRISARLHKDSLTLGIDLSGESLHKRGYRAAAGSAPIKENLAAGLLCLASWNDLSKSHDSFLDPMCGSGTILIEAAMIATDKAPGLAREKWGFDLWKGHDPELWSETKEFAEARFTEGKQRFKGRIVGFDQDKTVVSKAWENIKQAGLEDVIHVEKQALEDFSLFEKMQKGLLLTNPPYGERLGQLDDLRALYALLGQKFESDLLGWKSAIFTGNIELGKSVAWRSHKQYKLYNGAIESQLLLFNLEQSARFKEVWQSPDVKIHSASYWKVSNADRANMFSNRIKKNLKSIGKWANKNKVDCYRLYDADMPEFSIAVDVYRTVDKAVWLHVQEYAAPKTVDPDASFERLREALAVLSGNIGESDGSSVAKILDVPPENIVLKRRSIQKGAAQYEKNSASSEYLQVNENGARIQVNLKDYLDTGLFLDHRAMRRWVAEHSKGKRFLNLFCYTATVSVNAALGGAKSSLSIDMSKTYLTWAKENFQANQMDLSKHKLTQMDCLEWLKSTQPVEPFDLIFLDPPSFSNSKRMQGVLDIQRDHSELIDLAMKRLNPGGKLVFSNNLRRFKLEADLFDRYKVTDYTKKSKDKDFERNTKIHQCWLIEA